MLNVLPNDKRNLLYYENWLLIIRQSCIILVVSFCVVAIMLFGSHMILTSWFSTLAADSTSSVTINSVDAQAITTTVQKLRQLTNGLSAANSSWHNPLPLVKAIIQQFPGQVSLTTLEMSYQNNELNIAGVASDRSTIAPLQERFDGLTLDGYQLDKPKFTVTDLTLKEQIPFTFSATVIPTK